jgi:epoxyqueuosine reductase
MSPTLSRDTIHALATEHGFPYVGVVAAEPSEHLDAYLHWIEAGMHGAMGYLARPDRLARRRDLNVILPNVRALVLVGMDYGASVPPEVLHDPSRGRIASYAWGADYHDVMTPRLEALAVALNALAADSGQQRVYVDTGAILERSHATRAGMGFIGKNTMLIHPRRGSNFFIGEILTTLEVDTHDTPHRPTLCGTCTRCLAACPTDAFPRPYVLDARRCISYHTIENKHWIAHDLRGAFGNWVYGCDVCQDVCPWNRFAMGATEAAYTPADLHTVAPPLLDLLALDDNGFRARYGHSPIYRIKRARLVRNACVAAGNWGDPQAVPALLPLLHDPSPLVRGHAGWALMQIHAGRHRDTVAAAYQRETDENARADFVMTLDAAL